MIDTSFNIKMSLWLNFYFSIADWYTAKISALKMIWRVYSYAREYWMLILLSNILMLVSSSFNIITPKYSGKVIDIVTQSKDLNDLINLIQRVTVIYLLHSLVDIARGIISSRVQRKISQKMKTSFF
jgi:ABC-type multidrug transport system fused ATPase/permease subunit